MCGGVSFPCFRHALQVLAEEEQQQHNTYADAGVGKVEHGREEDEVVASPHGHPIGPRGLNYRKVEHVDHLAVKERRVALAKGHEASHAERSGSLEYQAVEQAVDEVASRSCEHHSKAHDVALAEEPRLDHPPDVPAYGSNGHEAEEREHELVDEGHAVGHAVVLDELDEEPVGDVQGFAKRHVGLDFNLDDLVDNEDCGDDNHRNPSHADMFDVLFHCYFLRAFFDATLSVA